ncbi:MAG: hypothetical protein Q9192_007301 [Flavoplaca navasiana]
MDEGSGATISQIVPFLIPIEAAEEVATDAGAKLYDLAIPGTEDTARMLKDSGNSVGHFASEEEAWAAAKGMGEETFVKQTLYQFHQLSSPSPGQHYQQLLCSGNIAPSIALEDFETRIDDTDGAGTAREDDAYALDGQASEPYPSNEALYDPTDYKAITEADRSPLQSTSSETHASQPIYL